MMHIIDVYNDSCRTSVFLLNDLITKEKSPKVPSECSDYSSSASPSGRPSQPRSPQQPHLHTASRPVRDLHLHRRTSTHRVPEPESPQDNPQGNNLIKPVSYTYAFTVTTPTTAWGTPTFQTPAPIPPCSNEMCPELNLQTCQDEMGTSYGVLCDTHLSGIVITTSGKRKRGDGEDAERELHEASLAAGSLGEREADGELDARTYTRTFMGCADYCGMFDVSNCVGVSFNAGFEGNCQALASIDGSFVVPGEIAAVRM